MSVFFSGIEINFLGYKYLYRRLPASILSGGDTIASVVGNNKNLPSIYDPRGTLSPGMVPSGVISYRVWMELNQSFVSGMENVAQTAPSLPFGTLSLPEAVVTISHAKFALVLFEGHDVIDLPTKDLEKTDKGLVLPDKAYRVYHAGIEKLVPPGGNVSLNASIAFATNTQDNLFRRIVPSEGVARDAREISVNQGKQFVDTASNIVEVDGSPSYISYTAVNRTLFRDVVVVRAGAFGFGAVSPTSGFILTDTGAGETYFQVLRFVLVDMAELTGDEGKKGQLAWKLSESYGVAPKGNVENTPLQLLQTEEQKIQDLADKESKHYVYNLAENIGEEISGDFSPIPLKSAFSPLLAKNKKDPTTAFYDESFRASVVERDLGYASNGGLVTYHSVTTAVQNTSLVPSVSYTSPKLHAQLGTTGRVGMEYAIGNIQTKTLLADLILLALTKESSPGIALCYDRDQGLALVVESFLSSYGSVVVERVIDDHLWTTSRSGIPESELKSFTIGDFPLRSHAGTSFISWQTKAELGKDGLTKSGKKLVPTSILVKSGTGFEGMLKLFDKEGKTIEEFATQARFGGSVYVAVAPMDFASVSGNNLDVVSVYGIEPDSPYALALAGTSPTSLHNVSGLQISKIKKQAFPVLGSNVTATSDSWKGWSFMAFENEGRVDFAVRKGLERNWLLVRDVVLRVPDEVEKIDYESTKPQEFPSCTLPFLLGDSTNGFLFLFYAYKNHILSKKIPTEIFDEYPNEDPFGFSAENEAQLISAIHSIYPSIVYDGSSGDNDALAADFSLGVIQPQSTTEAPVESGEETVAKIGTQIGGLVSVSGYLFLFIGTDGKIAVRRSPNLGDTWQDVFPKNTTFISIPSGTAAFPEESPSCLYDPSCDMVVLFFFVKNTLVSVRIPIETMLEPPSMAKVSVTEQMALLALAGNYDQELFSRGIMPAKSVSGQGKETPVLTPHRVAGYVTSEGYYRVFFRDQDQKMRSLFSLNTGNDWITETQLLGVEAT